MLPAFSLIWLLTWNFCWSYFRKQWGNMSINKARKGLPLEQHLLILRMVQVESRYILFHISEGWHEKHWKTVLLLRRRYDHIFVFFNKYFLCLESLVTLNGKATFFIFPWLHSRSTWPPAEIWLQGWDLGSATCVYIFYQNEGSLFPIPNFSSIKPVNRDITL